MVENQQSQLLEEIKKLETSARTYQQEVPNFLLLTNLCRANTSKLSVSWRSYWRLRKFISEQTQGNSHARANSYVKFVIFLQSITWRRRMWTLPSTSSRSQRSSVRTTSSAKQWHSTTWPATTVVLAKCDLRSISCNKRWQSRPNCRDPRCKPTLIWTFAPSYPSWTSTSLRLTTLWVPSSCFKRWCCRRSWTLRAILTMMMSKMMIIRCPQRLTRTEPQFWRSLTITWALNRSSWSRTPLQSWATRRP